jgi:hypothetical protein
MKFIGYFLMMWFAVFFTAEDAEVRRGRKFADREMVRIRPRPSVVRDVPPGSGPFDVFSSVLL